MAWTKYFTKSFDEYSGYVNTCSQFVALKQAFEQETNTYFCETRSTAKHRLLAQEVPVDLIKKSSFFWNEPQPQKVKGLQLEFDGHPKAVIGTLQLHCRFGSPRNAKQKELSKKKKEDDMDVDHPVPSRSKIRRRVQTTMKLGCSAQIRVRDTFSLTGVKIPKNDKYNRKKGAKLRQEYLQQNDLPHIERRILITLPKLDDHDVPHLMSEEASFVAPINKAVLNQLQHLTQNGVTSTDEMKRHLDNYVKKELFAEINPPSYRNRHFYPSKKDIYNHMYLFRRKTKLSDNDQHNVDVMVQRWKSEKDDSFYYRPNSKALHAESEETTSPQSFLFVHQTKEQSRLLQKYGNNLSLLDATYKTCKYNLPLFLLCVATNVGYTPVALFIVERETTECITEALQILKEWNPEWLPSHFLVDFDESEIQAIQSVFTSTSVLLCFFHRERAWDRWLSAEVHGMRAKKEEALKILQRIARSSTEVEYEENLEELQSSPLMQENERFKAYVMRKWIPNHKKWVDAFRNKRVLNFINTTNGVESKHKELKYSCLQQYSDFSVEGLVSALVNQFVPHMNVKYQRANVRSSSLYKEYSDEVPSFLKDRPKLFLEHCLKSLPPEKIINLDDIKCLGDGLFEVLSEEGGGYYSINLNTPVCTCLAWTKRHLPCKHMLAIFTQTDTSWDCLPADYTSHPFFNLDTAMIFETCETTPILTSISENLEHPQSSPVQERNSTPTNKTFASLIPPASSEKKTVNRKKSCESIRRNCVQLLKHLENLVFLTSDVQILKSLEDQIQKYVDETSETVPTYKGLHRLPSYGSLKNSHRRKPYRLFGKLGKMSPFKAKKSVHPKKQYAPNASRKHNTSSDVASTELLYCVCQSPYDDKRSMIECSKCHGWFHQDCMKMSDSDFQMYALPGIPYYCVECINQDGVRQHKFSKLSTRKSWTPTGKNTIKMQKKKTSHKVPAGLKYVGLHNLGQSCWLNSSLQALNAILKDQKLETVEASDSIIKPLLQFILHMNQQSPGTDLKPDLLKEQIHQWPCQDLQERQNGQKDPDEFLSFCLPHLSELDLFEKIEAEWKTTFTVCGHVNKNKSEKSYSLPLAIFLLPEGCDGPILLTTVKECLNGCLNFIEVVSGDMTCGCGKKGEVKREMAILNSPKILMLTLKRFSVTGNAVVKLREPVEIDREILLNGKAYQLVAVLFHSGHSTFSGHYYCFVLDNKSNVLVNCDDTNISQIPMNALTEPKYMREAYILFYALREKEKNQSKGVVNEQKHVSPSKEIHNTKHVIDEDDPEQNNGNERFVDTRPHPTEEKQDKEPQGKCHICECSMPQNEIKVHVQDAHFICMCCNLFHKTSINLQEHVKHGKISPIDEINSQHKKDQLEKQDQVKTNTKRKGKTRRGLAKRLKALGIEESKVPEVRMIKMPYIIPETFEEAKASSYDSDDIEEFDFTEKLQAVVPRLKSICLLDKSISDEARNNVTHFCESEWKSYRRRKCFFGKEFSHELNFLRLTEKIKECAMMMQKEDTIASVSEPTFKWQTCSTLFEKFKDASWFVISFIEEVLTKEAFVMIFAKEHKISEMKAREICLRTEIDMP